MKLRRLHAASFAAIREVDIEFGPGLNVLYGPNDLGKSTLVAAIRLALLLPHSNHTIIQAGGKHSTTRSCTYLSLSLTHT